MGLCRAQRSKVQHRSTDLPCMHSCRHSNGSTARGAFCLVPHLWWADVFWAPQTPALICIVNNMQQKTLINKIISKHLKFFFFFSFSGWILQYPPLPQRQNASSKARDPKQPSNMQGMTSPLLCGPFWPPGSGFTQRCLLAASGIPTSNRKVL